MPLSRRYRRSESGGISPPRRFAFRSTVGQALVPFHHLAVIAVVQGITEFLPVSSSGHLVLIPAAAGWADQGLVLDVAVHAGTLAAVVVYFRRDLGRVLAGAMGIGRGERREERRAGRALGLRLAVSAVPALAAGGAIAVLAPSVFRDPAIVGWTTLGFGIVLYAADRFGMTMRRVADMSLRDAVVIGLAQALALVPGTSRSGITMTAARFLGYERTEAARFSMLMSVPVIAAAALAAGWELARRGDAVVAADAVLAAALSFATALAAIAALLALLRRTSFTPFAIYRVLLGAALLGWLYSA